MVEDDELLLNAFSLALAKAGYSVTACQTGQEAKAHFMQEKGQYDLLLTDVVFPDSTGPKLSEELKALNSNLKTVLVSGYTQNTVLHHNSNGQGLVLIQKPVSTYRLLSTLRQVLNGSLVRGVI